jgi:hypothetical protein
MKLKQDLAHDELEEIIEFILAIQYPSASEALNAKGSHCVPRSIPLLFYAQILQ